MKTSIGAYDATARSVPVTFTQGDIVHKRTINACFGTDGKYDSAATEARVADVTRGVAIKIAIGAIANPVEEAETAA